MRKEWLLFAASLALALGAAEAVVRHRGTGVRYPLDGAEIELDPEVLFRFVGGSRPDLNSDGYRDTEFTPERRRARRVLFLGDSFVMGEALAPEETLPHQLERLLGPDTRVYNLGVTGYGPDQSLLRYRYDGARLAHDDVVLALFPGNDFQDLVKNRLVESGADGALRWTDTNPVRERLPAFRLALVFRRATRGPLADADRELAALLFTDAYDLMAVQAQEVVERKVRLMRAVLAGFVAQSSAYGARLTLLLIPTVKAIEKLGYFDQRGVPRERALFDLERAAEIARDLGIHTVDLSLPFRTHRDDGLYIPRDGHLSTRGAELAARVLATGAFQRSDRQYSVKSGTDGSRR